MIIQSIHRCTSIKAGGVNTENANSVRLTVQAKTWDGGNGTFEITLFDLPLEVAEKLSSALRDEASQ